MSGAGGGGISQHPVDRLIRELIRTGRPATPEEVERIIERMATVPFNPRQRRVRGEERGASYQGYTLGAREEALRYHLIKRVVIEKQWAEGTTEEQYLADLRRAVSSSAARLVVFERRGGFLAATITPTDLVIPVARHGSRSLPVMLVIYAADRGIIVSGYQFSSLETVRIPEEARWLR